MSALGFDDVFQRMWELYLAYSEAGFRSGYLDVYQWTFAPTGAVADELRRRLRVLAGDPDGRARHHVRRRPPDRPLQRRRRHVGRRLRRRSAPSRQCWAPATSFRRILLLVLVAVWGLRLAWHMVGKSAGKGEDPRYGDLLRGDFSAGNVLRKIFLIQAAATWFISLPLQLSAGARPDADGAAAGAGRGRGAVGGRRAVRGGRRSPVAPVQGRSRQPGHRSWTAACGRGPAIPTTSVTRACGGGCGWSSIAGWVSLPTVLSPVLMTYFLVYATGARLTEKHHGRPAGLSRILFAHFIFRSEAAQIANIVTISTALARLPLVTADLDALLRQVAQRDVDAFAAFYDQHPREGVRPGHPRAARSRLQRGDHAGRLPAGMAHRGQLRPGRGLAAGLADDAGAPARRRPGALRAGGQPARVPLRRRQRRATRRPRRRGGRSCATNAARSPTASAR